MAQLYRTARREIVIYTQSSFRVIMWRVEAIHDMFLDKSGTFVTLQK
jgi:hypothetical protein